MDTAQSQEFAHVILAFMGQIVTSAIPIHIAFMAGASIIHLNANVMTDTKAHFVTIQFVAKAAIQSM